MQVYNDLSRKKEELIPQVEGQYKIYVCGPTVYDYFHLGNARPFIVYDTLRRYLEYLGNEVTYVQNFTDIDDKVIRRANEQGITYKELADSMIEEYFKDADGLHIKRANVHPRATDCIEDIVSMIKTLDEKGYAYVLSDGVYFDTGKYEKYGALSRRELDEGVVQDRVGVNIEKRHPSDFVLWKFKKPGEPAWDAPWGEGRPGWHIECSAMNLKYLGETVDIHGGGQDLIFPHHENEIAQTEAVTGKQFVRYWMHNGFINIDNVKMAKSEGNFFTVRDLTKKYSYSVLRFFMLQAHYRMPINFSRELLEAAGHGWQRMKNFAGQLDFLSSQETEQSEKPLADDETIRNLCAKARRDFVTGMDDDLNTSDAFAAIFNLVRESNSLLQNSRLSQEALSELKSCFGELLEVLGLDPWEDTKEEIPPEILAKAEQRVEAKKAKDWAKADALRDEINAAGWKIEDTAEGVKLSKL